MCPVCLYVCVYVYMYVCVCMCVCVRVCVCVSARVGFNMLWMDMPCQKEIMVQLLVRLQTKNTLFPVGSRLMVLGVQYTNIATFL